ncbi:MAG: hypothetical protein ACK5G7_02960 [Erysipelotrichaceae bacterium]
MKLITEDLILKYAIAFGRRFTVQQKSVFLDAIGQDFQKLGYDVRGAAEKYKRKYAINLHVGDVGNADNIIVVNYDTPQHNFGNPMKYYPFDGPATFASGFLPIYTPAIIGGVISLWLLLQFFPKLDFADNLGWSLFLLLILFLVMSLSFVLTRGVANKVNFNRNTSGVVAALKLASVLSKNQKKNTAFVLTDNGCTNHYGDKMLRAALPKSIDQRLVIMLDCVGVGCEFVVGYKEASKQEAITLAKGFKKKSKRKSCSAQELRYTSFSFYQRALLISKGDFFNGSLMVDNVSTNKDINCHVDNIDEVVSALKDFLV